LSTGGDVSITLDGIPLSGAAVTLVDDQQEHSVEVRIAAATG
jgi:hypothetical protein